MKFFKKNACKTDVLLNQVTFKQHYLSVVRLQINLIWYLICPALERSQRCQMPGMNNAVWPRGCSSTEKSQGYMELLFNCKSEQQALSAVTSHLLGSAWIQDGTEETVNVMDIWIPLQVRVIYPTERESNPVQHRSTAIPRASLKKGLYQKMLT